MRKKRILALVLVCALALGMTACGSSAEAPAQPTEAAPAAPAPTEKQPEPSVAANADTIVFGIADSLPGIFHPLLASKTTDQDVNRILFPSLLQLNENGEAVPYEGNSKLAYLSFR